MRNLSPLLLILLIIGCEVDNNRPDVVEEPKLVVENNPEQLVLDEEVEDLNYGGLEIKVQDFTEDAFLFQGDILIDKNFKPAKVLHEGEESKATARTKGFWPNNTVYYQIDPNLPKQYRVLDAIKHWEESTNLKFINNADAAGYIYFTPGNGCSSYIGKTGYRQNITLASGCSTGNTIHEIGHAVGLWHEQSRADRDKWIAVKLENVLDGTQHNFYTYIQMGTPGQELDNQLDFGSVMMYSPYAFSKNWEPTITKLDGSLYETNRSNLSTADIAGINKLYPSIGEPTYVNGERYVIYGLTVLRYNDAWWYNSRVYGLCKVVYRNNNWYYARS